MAEGYRWHHSVNPDWIKARKFVFTATELRSLVPAYKRWLRKKDPEAIDPDFAALVAEKLSTTNGIDVNTFSWAARGHIMEPYALKEFRRQNKGMCMYHWDDYVIGDLKRWVGFSPDGLNAPLDDEAKSHIALNPYFAKEEAIPNFINAETFMRDCLPTVMVEVKCYAPSKHMKAILAEPNELEERYQIAVGMMVCPSIVHGVLVFYNPTINLPSKGSYYEVIYSRKDLEEEIELMERILSLAISHLRRIKNTILPDKCDSCLDTEDYIYSKFQEEEMQINEII